MHLIIKESQNKLVEVNLSGQATGYRKYKQDLHLRSNSKTVEAGSKKGWMRLLEWTTRGILLERKQ